MDRIFPKILSWTTEDNVLFEQLIEIKEGICIFENTDILETPIEPMKNLFRKLYDNPSLARRLNDVYLPRGIFNDRARRIVDNVDQKVCFDFSPNRLEAILDNDEELSIHLGKDFDMIVSFFACIQDVIVPRLAFFAENAISATEMRIHRHTNFNYRLVEYFKIRSNNTRCAPHRDYGTFTLIFQDFVVDGLEVFVNDKWVSVPPTGNMIFLWGMSATIMSNGRLNAPLHRVVTTCENVSPQRNAVVFFVAPDLDIQLVPHVCPDEKLAFDPELIKDLTVAEFKELMGKRWRYREGNPTSDERREIRKAPWNFATMKDDDISEILKNRLSD